MAEPCEGPLSVVDYGVAEDANKRFRQDMEDGHIAIDGFAGQKDQGFFAVYDGHGGRQVMEYVQEKLHLTVAEELQAGSGDVSVPDALTRAYLRTDKELEERGLTAGGTTSVTTVVQGKTSKSPVVYCANAGDARAVLCRDGVAHRLSYDHKPTDPAERRRVTEMGGTVIRGRVMSVLAVSRALGDIELKPYVTASPYCTATPLEAKDEFLIIACDGLFDVMSDQESVDFVLECKTNCKVKDALGVAPRLAKMLVNEALKRGTRDNVTIMIVML